MEVNIHYAKTNLSQLLLKAESGEEVVIARAGKPIVRLIPVQSGEGKKCEAEAHKETLIIPPGAFSSELGEKVIRWFNESPLLRSNKMARQEKADKKSHKHGKHKR
jgi:prevent-host-death family protein